MRKSSNYDESTGCYLAEYNFEDRLNQSSNKLQHLFKNFDPDGYKNKGTGYKSISYSLTKEPEAKQDVPWILIADTYKQAIQETRGKIEKYGDKDKHFTHQFRVLREECVQHQLKLDLMDTLDREDIKTERKKALIEVAKILKLLEDKTHENGELCSDCEKIKL